TAPPRVVVRANNISRRLGRVNPRAPGSVVDRQLPIIHDFGRGVKPPPPSPQDQRSGRAAPRRPSLLLLETCGVLGGPFRLPPARVEVLQRLGRGGPRQRRGRATCLDGLERRQEDRFGLRGAALPGEAPAELEPGLERAGVPGRERPLQDGGGPLEEGGPPPGRGLRSRGRRRACSSGSRRRGSSRRAARWNSIA